MQSASSFSFRTERIILTSAAFRARPKTAKMLLLSMPSATARSRCQRSLSASYNGWVLSLIAVPVMDFDKSIVDFPK